MMKICHVCKTECEETAELCPVCGADLTSMEEEQAATRTEISNPVLVASVEDVVSAEIFKDILKDNGIMFSCDDTNDEGTIRVVFGGGFVSSDIYVDSEDYDAAEKLYNEFLESDSEFVGEFFDGEEDFEALDSEE